jgi:hypothetical protein
MSREKEKSINTSRRQFTKVIASAAVALPIVACKSDNTNNATVASTPPAKNCELQEADGNGFSSVTWARKPPEDHIPPMGIVGGSLVIDSTNIFKETASGGGTWTYDEESSLPNNKRYGNIEGVTIITEALSVPYLTHRYYNAFQPGTKLWIWYQNIKATASGDDTDFDNIGAEPDMKLNGGKGADGFRIVIARKKFDYEKSHRKNRPHRYRHVNIGGERHFRIGKYQFLSATNQILFEDNGADNYRIYLEFGHYQP